MPLRDHFRPPLDDNASWEELHGGWPMVIVQQLRKQLPAGYVAGPRVHLGSLVNDEYEVRIYDAQRGRHLVAAIEIVSPGNKSRPEHRNAFIAKCAALLQKGVAVSIVDLVTIRRFNLYAQLMAFVGHPDPSMKADEPPTYAASCRWVTIGTRARLEAWSYAMTIDQPLPTLPLWLAEALVIPLDLEQSYEQACHDLWIS